MNKAGVYMHNRQNALRQWLEKQLNSSDFSLIPLCGDASFRCYFRLTHCHQTYIVMDAPPSKESLKEFIHTAQLFRELGIITPQIHAQNTQEGFLLLEDFGDTLLLSRLNLETADHYYQSAIDVLTLLHRAPPNEHALPRFCPLVMQEELQRFNEWFLLAYLKLEVSVKEKQCIENVFTLLCNELSALPQVIIHRDYHSRNMMVLDRPGSLVLGIIDFQDAMIGPVTYDFVSLLKDCYIQWPKAFVRKKLTDCYHASPIAQQMSFSQFTRAFDLCGLQRHLKVLGTFARLFLRDNKPNYLNDLPLTLQYVLDCLESYPEFHSFYQFMQQRIRLP